MRRIPCRRRHATSTSSSLYCRGGLIDVEPPHPPAGAPLTGPLYPAVVDKHTSPVLSSLFPLADKTSTIWPLECALTLFLVVAVLALISPPIAPRHLAMTAELVLFPLTRVQPSVRPLVAAFSVKSVVAKLTAILSPIRPLKHAISVFDSLNVRTLVPRSVVVHLESISVRRVGTPLA